MTEPVCKYGLPYAVFVYEQVGFSTIDRQVIEEKIFEIGNDVATNFIEEVKEEAKVTPAWLECILDE